MCYETNPLIDKLTVIPVVILVEVGNAIDLHWKVPTWNLHCTTTCPD
jgi:hypothetical protein